MDDDTKDDMDDAAPPAPGRSAALPDPRPDMHEVGADPSGKRSIRQHRLLRHFGMVSSSRVLEIGCGVGRLAHELADDLTEGSYAGFDISPEVIAWLNENYAPLLDNFRFDLVDVANPRYRPEGGARGTEVRFPYDDASFDIACCFSVFMHLQLDEIRNYLEELHRVLVPGGRALVTALTITDEDVAPENGGKRFVHLGGGVWTNKPKRPGFGMAYDMALFRTAVADAGLVVDEWVEGFWHGRFTLGEFPASGPDLFVVRRPA